ncbi:hypothetical protein BGZ52_011600 [Haplosporangium bisporale]|nr:hypothetical protein BGZ52_011600 [Haplosporangium bisporale]
MQQPLQTATNRVYMRGDPDYQDHCYQYGSSSNEGIIQPAAIIYAANDDDVIKAINYAKTNKIAVAVRTGVYRDEDHPNSRGLRAQYLYSRDRLKRLLDVMVDMVDDNDFPGDYDYCVSVVSSCCLLLPSFILGMNSVDERMRRLHPELFGVDKQFLWPKTILVYAQWANLGGAQQQYNPEFFNKIKAAGGIPLLGVPVDDDVHKNMSELTTHWIWPNAREFDLPYIRRAGFTNSTTLRADGWTDWVSDRIDLIQSDAFNEYAKAKAAAEQWQAGNDAEGVGHPNAKFCKEDRRLLSFSHDLDLDPVHKHYYDNDPAKYRRLCDIKRYWDPERVFTPNAFSVGGILNPVRTPNPTLIDDRQMVPKL